MEIPSGYLDTNLIIGLAEEDLASAEMAALDDLLRRQKNRQIRLRPSRVAKPEVERRSSGPDRVSGLIYMLLEDVPAVDDESEPDHLVNSSPIWLRPNRHSRRMSHRAGRLFV
jgi:hypothetical protein